MSTKSYGIGCESGHHLAQEWLSNSERSNPKHGGTLQYVIFELAEQFKAAKKRNDKDHVRGKIVGFCYALECPQDAAKCRAASRKGGAA